METTREELLALNKDNENLEADLAEIKSLLREQKKTSRKLEEIVSDCAKSLQTALTVSMDVEHDKDTIIDTIKLITSSNISVWLET